MFEIEIINDEGERDRMHFEPEEIHNICRSCLNKNAMVNLFEVHYKGIPFSQIFNTFFTEINPSENLPKHICDVCVVSIAQFCAFKEQILQSQNILQMAYGEVNQEVKTECREGITDNCDDSEYREHQVDEIKSSENEDWYRTREIDNDIREKIKNKVVQTLIIDQEEKLYTCKHCEKIFYNHREYKNHRARERLLRRPPEKCHICDKSVKPNRLKNHLILHEERKSFFCDICGKKFLRKENINRHKYTHTTVKPHMCHICGKGFIQAPSLTDHLRSHYESEPFVSQFCGRTFNTKQALQQHLRYHQLNPDSDCKEKKSRTTNSNLTCQHCEKRCTTKQGLEIHVRSHTGERPYGCNVCGKRFVQKQHLTGHLRIHNGEKPHSCRFCGKRFALTGNLNQHIKIHTGERPFVCSFCDKGFCTTTSLKKHKRVHGITE